MGQCASQPQIEDGNNAPLEDHSLRKTSRPGQELKQSSCTVATTMEDASFSIVNTDRTDEHILFEKQIEEKEQIPEEATSESDEESQQSGAGYEDESEDSDGEDDDDDEVEQENEVETEETEKQPVNQEDHCDESDEEDDGPRILVSQS